jgi:D-arabinitol dehydrogenase (NADP+)
MKGLGSNFPGFFAEYATVREDLVFSVEGIHPDTAVFTEPAACAMHGLESLQIRPGSTALVFGAGPTGLLLAQLIRSGGAASVTVAAPTPFKLETAKALGVDQTVLLDRADMEGNRARLLDASGADGYDYVVEATGSTAIGNICVPLTRNGGTVLVYGVTRADETVSFHPFDVFRREITIKGSFAEMTSFGAAIRALRSGRARTDGIITHRFSLDDYGKALDAVAGDRTAHKVVIAP